MRRSLLRSMAIATMLLAGPALAGQDVSALLGSWEIEMPGFGGGPGGRGGGPRGGGARPGGGSGDGPPMQTLTFQTDADGNLVGTWADRRGTTTLADVAYDDGKITFKRTMQTARGEFELDYEVWVRDGALAGLIKTPRGEREFSGKRADS